MKHTTAFGEFSRQRAKYSIFDMRSAGTAWNLRFIFR